MDAEEPPALLPPREHPARHIYEGYTYNVERDNDDETATYLVYNLKKRSRCKGRGILRNARFRKTKDHNHAADPEADTINDFKKQLRLSCERQFRNQKDIYDELRLLYPEAAVTVTYASIESSMRRWRKLVHPRIPATLAEYGVILRLPQWTHVLDYRYGEDTFHLDNVTLTATDDSVSVVFGNPNFIEMLAATTEIFVDATFKVVPAINGAYQLLTVMATFHDHALPFTWALMSRKTRPAYDCIFEYIRTTLAPAITPTSFMTDFERALQNSLSAVYQEAVPHGCFFHYCQALYRRARSLHVTEAIANDEVGCKILRKIMGLALLPGHEVGQAYGVLMMNASPEHSRIFGEFFEYYERQWLRRVTPRLFSVYGLIRRTNNSVESYHRVLVEKMAPHPNIWDFTKKLVNIQFAAHVDYLALQRGNAVSRAPKIGYVLSHRRIMRAWDKLEERRLTVAEFVEQASHFVTTLARNLGFVAHEVDDDDHDRDLIDGYIGPDDPLPDVPQDMAPPPAVEAPVAAPFEGPVAALLEVPHAAPVRVPAAAPFAGLAAARLEIPLAALVEVPAAVPVEGPLAAPVEVPAAAPVEVPAAAPDHYPAPYIPDNIDVEREFPAVNFLQEDGTDSEDEDLPLLNDVPRPILEVVADRMQSDCLACTEAQSCYLCLPCYHMVLCGTCANRMLQLAYDYDNGENGLFGQVNCPLCGRAVVEFKRVFMPVM